MPNNKVLTVLIADKGMGAQKSKKGIAEWDVMCESSLAFMLWGGGGGEVRAASDGDDLLLLAK